MIEDRIYNRTDFDRSLVIDQRTRMVAKRVSQYLKKTDRFAKTIIFCVDTEHAERMRQAMVNENSDLIRDNPRYVVRITGDDEFGKQELYNFTAVKEKLPVVATTSKLLTTGVDTKMVKLIVLDATIQSMSEFKQIIGRGTRLREKDGKVFFTIIDFRKVTRHFADPDFDGDPVIVFEPEGEEDIVPPDETIDENSEGENETGNDDTSWPTGGADDYPRKYYVNDVSVAVINERVQYYDANGRLITESLKDYSRHKLLKAFASLDEFLLQWSASERKEVIVDELAAKGVFFEELQKEIGLDVEPFDLICHIAFDQPPLTRKERAESVRKRDCFTKYGEEAQQVLDALLGKYADEGISSIETKSILRIKPINEMGTPMEIVGRFGDTPNFERAMNELEQELYRRA